MDKPLLIVGIGAVTALSTQAALNAAAARAGIARIRLAPLPDERMFHLASVGALDDELPRHARLSALLRSALDQCTSVLGAERGGHLPSIPLFVSAPDDAELAEYLVFGPGGARANWQRVRRLERGHGAALGSLDEIRGALESGSTGLACIAGVDVRSDAASVEELALNARLLQEDNPWGIAPGEGAGALLLATREACQSFNLRSLSRIRGYGSVVESAYARNMPCIGTALSSACHQALSGLESAERITEIYCDLTPERARCDEWGFTAPRIAKQCQDVSDFVVPSRQWGDVGCATGPLLTILAAVAMAREYARGPLALVWSASESGLRAAVVLERAAGPLANVTIPAPCLPLSAQALEQDEALVKDLLDEASFLFEQRSHYLGVLERESDSEVHFSALASIEERLEAQIDGLLLAGREGALCCQNAPTAPGACYAAGRVLLAQAPEALRGYLTRHEHPDKAQAQALRTAMAHGAKDASSTIIAWLMGSSPFLAGLGLLLAAECNQPTAVPWRSVSHACAEEIGVGFPQALVTFRRTAEARDLLEDWLDVEDVNLARAAAFALLRLDRQAAYPLLWSRRERPSLWLPLVVGSQSSQLAELERHFEQTKHGEVACEALAFLGSRTAFQSILERFAIEPRVAARALHLITGVELFDTIQTVSVIPDESLTHPELLARRGGDRNAGVIAFPVRRMSIDRDSWETACAKVVSGFKPGERHRLGKPLTREVASRAASHPLLSPGVRAACVEELAVRFMCDLPMRSDARLRECASEIARAISRERV